MTLKEFAKMLDGREYLREITKEEEALAKELGFVVVFGYSDDNAELRGVIDDEIGCFDGGKIEHKDLPDVIYAKWCDREINYALNVFADLYDLAPVGDYEVVYDFGDITYSRDEDRVRWWGYVQAGKVPAWMFFVKFEGMTEEDARAMVAEAAPKTPSLFGGEE